MYKYDKGCNRNTKDSYQIQLQGRGQGRFSETLKCFTGE